MSTEASDSELEDNIIITEPDVVGIIFHEKKQELLKLLIKTEKTIVNLSEITKLNPGTIKRHLNDLEKYHLIKLARIEKNEYGIAMKFYRATAKKYIVNLEFP